MRDTPTPTYDISALIPIWSAAPFLYDAAKPLADLVEHFSGDDEAMISVSAGELRHLAAAVASADGRAPLPEFTGYPKKAEAA